MGDGPATTVLIVEDDPLIASFMMKALKKNDYDVECVANGRAALDRLDGGGVALMLLDLGLPDIDGLDVLREIRSDGSPLPVIVVTSRSDPADRTTAQALGVTGYVVKPFPLADLLTQVRAAIGAGIRQE